jgi:hypothetical protein
MSKSMEDLELMSKIELEDYGRTVGIELDRRESKEHLIKQLEENIMSKKKKAKSALGHLADAVKDTVASTSEAVSKNVLIRSANTGQFSEGKQPKGSPSGKYGGVPFWEV